MTRDVGVQEMALDVLAQHCAQETDLYLKQKVNDTRFCFELFRRAIQEESKAAWEAICAQYEKMVTSWVTRHSAFSASGEEAQYFVNGAFGKISGTLTAEKFGMFSDLPALLKYLKLCVHSVIVDFTRINDFTNLTDLDKALKVKSKELSPEEWAVEQSEGRTLWNLLESRLQDRKERLVIHGSFVLDLKPQEIMKHFPVEFSDIDEIYRIKQNVINRLRRDDDFRQFLGVDD